MIIWTIDVLDAVGLGFTALIILIYGVAVLITGRRK